MNQKENQWNPGTEIFVVKKIQGNCKPLVRLIREGDRKRRRQRRKEGKIENITNILKEKKTILI